MASLVPKMFSDEDVTKEQIEFGNCCEEQRENEGDVGTEEELIELVKACPILYDVRLKVYKDRNLKDSAWRSVAEAMKLGVLECKNKWKNIRDAYVKYLHSFKDEHSMSGRKLKRRYKYADKMNFLDKCIQHRNSTGSLAKPKRESILNQSSLSMVVNYSDENQNQAEPLQHFESSGANILNPTVPSSAENSHQGHCKTQVGSQDSSEGENDRKRKHESDKNEDISQQTSLHDEHDDSKLFCLSLITTLKRLNARKRQLAKLKIQNILYEIEFSSSTEATRDFQN